MLRKLKTAIWEAPTGESTIRPVKFINGTRISGRNQPGGGESALSDREGGNKQWSGMHRTWLVPTKGVVVEVHDGLCRVNEDLQQAKRRGERMTMTC